LVRDPEAQSITHFEPNAGHHLMECRDICISKY
jgi:hypothetical protein